jgi:glucokinase
VVRYFIGVDVGGTTSTICVGNDRREVLLVSDQFDTRSSEGPQAAIQAIATEAAAVMEQMGASLADVAAAGLATPGPATVDGVLLKTPNLHHAQWDRFPIRGELERALRPFQPALTVRYIGDGQAAALGEYAIRNRSLTWSRVSAGNAGDSLSSLFMVIVGTGLGGGGVRDGVPIRGIAGRAGHVGHIFLPADAFRYEHDQQLVVGNSCGTAESAVSLSGLAHQLTYRLQLDRWQRHRLKTAPGSVRDKAKTLRALAAEGDPLALELFQDQARALGIALLSVNYLGDYDRLIIGGGVCDLSDGVKAQYLRDVEQSYLEHALDGFRDQGLIEYSICGDNAPVIGALAWVLDGGRAGSP